MFKARAVFICLNEYYFKSALELCSLYNREDEDVMHLINVYPKRNALEDFSEKCIKFIRDQTLIGKDWTSLYRA